MQPKDGFFLNPLPPTPESYGEGYFRTGGVEDAASHYEDYRRCKGILWELHHAMQSLAPQLYQPKPVVDAGCAYAHSVAFLRVTKCDAYGFDFSQFAIEQALKCYPQLRDRLWIQSVTDPLMKFGRKGVGLITCSEVLEHVESERINDVLHSFRYAADWAFLTIGCRENSRAEFTDGGDKTHQTYFLKSWWIEKLLEYGELDWDLMTRFSYKVKDKEPELDWSRRFFALEFK